MEKQASIKSNFIYNIFYQTLIILLPLITAPYVSRILGAENIGIYSYTQAFANYFFLLGMLGVNNYGNRTIARVRDNKQEMSKTFWEIYIFQFSLSIITAVIYIIIINLTVNKNYLIYLLQFFYIASAAFDVNWCCFGLEKFKLTTIRSTIVRLISAACIFIFVKDSNDLSIYTFILAISNLVSALAIWPFILKQVKFTKPSLKGIIKHIKPNLTLFLPVIAVSLYHIMDKIMLGYLSTEKEVGYYTNAERIIQIPNTLILALNNVIMPRMSNLYAKNDQVMTKKLMDKVMLFAMFMSSAMAFGLAGVSEKFAPWFYGEEFTRCGLFMKLLCPIIIFKGWAGVLRTQYIIPKGKDKVYITSLSLGAVINLITNSLLIPKYNGIGVVIGTLLAEFTVCIIQFSLIHKEISLKNYLKDGFAFCLIGLFMYLIISRINYLGISNTLLIMLIQIIIGFIVYIILATLYIIKIKKDSTLLNEIFKIMHLKFRF